MSNEIMYDKNSILIAIGLFLSMLAVNQLCYLIGRRFQTSDENNEVKGQTAAIQAGIVGLLALLLGFTFNMSLQRYDARSNIVIEEAGTIAKAAMQASLLTNSVKTETLTLLEQYLELRISLSEIDLSDEISRRALNVKISELQSQLTMVAQNVIENSEKPAVANAFFQSISNIIYVENKRTAMLRLHVPEPVLFLLFFVFVTAGGMLGYTSGLHKKRPAFPTLLMSGLIVLVVFIVVDLDRPRRGIIQVNQDSLADTLVQIKQYQSA
ncbi:bestrophin-like domain [Aliiglaciecola lipolytica]|uniref:DUF4239 domain-containing protein n=1 Tax=Aliiglaciecola lipolytica E3 TaxID=1127673 RepID=K6XT14_9ALTE|nr:DUF4239 domain-containing protein [Aliiglaciecola lipolytica]GAC14791.1 hypothetical protein GLIP_2163 [Aliiglaciecola lipolytica E3]